MAGGFGVGVYPEFPALSALSKEDQARIASWWAAFMNEIYKRDAAVIAGAANGKPFWSLSHVSVNRTYDVSGATLAQTANALGTLLSDLKNKGVTA